MEHRMARSPALDRAAGRGVGPCPDLRPEEQSFWGREVGVRWRSGQGSPSWGGGRFASGCHLDQSKHPGATQGNA